MEHRIDFSTPAHAGDIIEKIPMDGSPLTVETHDGNDTVLRILGVSFPPEAQKLLAASSNNPEALSKALKMATLTVGFSDASA